MKRLPTNFTSKPPLTIRALRMKWTNRFLILMAVVFVLALIMSNGAIFLLPDECSGHVGILPAECIPENLK